MSTSLKNRDLSALHDQELPVSDQSITTLADAAERVFEEVSLPLTGDNRYMVLKGAPNGCNTFTSPGSMVRKLLSLSGEERTKMYSALCKKAELFGMSLGPDNNHVIPDTLRYDPTMPEQAFLQKGEDVSNTAWEMR